MRYQEPAKTFFEKYTDLLPTKKNISYQWERIFQNEMLCIVELVLNF